MLTCGVGGQRKGWGMRSTHSTVWKQTPSALCLFKSTLPAYSLNNLGHLILIWIKFKLKAQSTQSACQKKPPLCILVHTCGKWDGWGLQSIAYLTEQTAASWCRLYSSPAPTSNSLPYLCIHITPEDTWQLKHDSHSWEQCYEKWNESYLVWKSWSHL